MPLAAPIPNTKVKGQPAVRRYQRFRDQHGRRLGAMIEMKTGDPCGLIEPIGWKAPWLPEMKYCEVQKDEEGVVEVGKLYWNYSRMLADARRERQDFDERTAFFASAMYGEQAGKMIKQPPAELRRLMRGEPTHPELVVAAMKGDRWILGFEPGDPPEYLQPYLATVKVIDEAGDDLSGIDPEFLAKMEAAFEASRIQPREAPPELAGPAAQARTDSEREAVAAAARVAARGR